MTRNAFVHILPGLLAALTFSGCAETPQEPVAEEAKAPPEPIDGQTAFFRMFPAARSWSPDAEGLRLECIKAEEVEEKDGRFGAWRAGFYSASKNRVGVFNFSVVEVGDKIQQGVFQDHEEAFSGGLLKPWPVSALKTSSEKAYHVAMDRRETKEYVQKNPNMPIFILLEQTNRHPNLAWRIVWGESVSRSGFSIYVDASTGNFLEVMR